MAIDIGGGAAEYFFNVSDWTWIDKTNPANADGILDTLGAYFQADATGVKIGTFSGSDTSWAYRDFESIGNVSAGSRQMFSGLSCNVKTNDIIGYYASGGNLYAETSGGDGILYSSGDKFSGGSASYTLFSGVYKLALVGEGTESTIIVIFDYHFNNMRP